MIRNQFILTPYFLDEALPGLEALLMPGWYLNKPHLTNGGKMSRMSILHGSLAERVAQSMQRGERPVSIAGDCCTTLGVLAGMQRCKIGAELIWFDAHGDFNTWETTPSGFLGGMPLAMLVGRGEQTLINALQLRNLAEDRVTLSDARDLDPAERELMEKSSIHHLTDVRELLTSPLPDRPLYVHFDTDVLNPNVAPAMNYPAAGGPSAEELRKVFCVLANTSRIAAVSMSSWNPGLDANGQTQHVCMELLHALVDQ